MRQLTVRLDDSLFVGVCEYARKKGMTVTDYIREAVSLAVDVDYTPVIFPVRWLCNFTPYRLKDGEVSNPTFDGKFGEWSPADLAGHAFTEPAPKLAVVPQPAVVTPEAVAVSGD
jgi:hypothetical protein